MSVLIENYRGFAIMFEPDNERFSYSTDTGSWREKQSYAACKKGIDDYLKDNATFEPFKIITKRGNILSVIGIRKDGRFITQNGKGAKDQLSEYDEKNWHIYDPSLHDKIFATIAAIELERGKLDEQILMQQKLITTETVHQIKSKYLPPK